MSKLNYSELFYSIQGEARFSGVPSIFLRMFGCNFRCKKFGRDKGEIIEGPNPEVEVIIQNIDKYNTFKELPLVKTGCDSYSSIYPEFKKFVQKKDHNELTEEIFKLLPNNEWGDVHLVITGGEPLLGWQRAYPDLLMHEKTRHNLTEITFETNGTQALTPEFETYLFEEFTRYGRDYDKLTFSVSPKLSVSGEKWEDAIQPEVVRQYQTVGYTYLKFVVASKYDVAEAEKAVQQYRAAGFGGPVYIMPCGGEEEMYNLNKTQVAELALQKGWRYSDRLQIPLFKNAWGT
jgi:organic radical activating enzyme